MKLRTMAWLGMGLCAASTPAAAKKPDWNVDYGDYPAIVIGSGYGGSVAAYNLGKARVPVLVLERGRWWSVTDPTSNEPFPTAAEVLNPTDGDPSTQTGDPRVAWMRDTCGGNLYSTFPPGSDNCDRTTGLLESVSTTPNPDLSPNLVANGIGALVAAGVGGGSLVNNGISYAPPKEAWDVAFPVAELPHMQLVWAELDAHFFEKALERLGATPPPEDILASGYYAGTNHLYDFFGAVGYPEKDSDADDGTYNLELAPTIVDWDAVRDELTGDRVASVINGEAWWGINSGAKISLDTPRGSVRFFVYSQLVNHVGSRPSK